MTYATIISTIAVGLYLPDGGSFTNPASGAIVQSTGIEVANSPGTVTNNGLIAGMDFVAYPTLGRGTWRFSMTARIGGRTASFGVTRALTP